MAYTYKYGDRPLDGLTIQRAVGRGGFGEVYYALADSGKQLALKYLRENPEIELRGISHVLNLKSPHLVNIHDVRSSESGDVFVLMEYISGPSLRDLLNAEPAGFSPAKAAFFFSGIAKGLAYLHERGIVHRDLKPANIFYDDGYVKIGDYGLSKHISVSRHSGQTASVGTVHYMAPEIGSGSYTRAIDIYALGVILYEMLTGRLPFTGASMAEILMRHLNDRPDVSGIPAPFGPIIARSLAKDPAARYQDANEMLSALAEADSRLADVSRFDASQLTHVPRHDPADDVERTLTATPPRRAGPPVLDAREFAPPGAPVPPHLAARWEKRVRELSQRLEHKEARLARRFGGGKPRPLRPLEPTGETPPDRRRGAMPQPGAREGHSRLANGAVLIAATLAAALALAFLSTPKEVRTLQFELVNRSAVLAFALFGAALSTLLAYYLIIRRASLDSPLLNRFVFAGAGLIGLLPALAISSGAHTVEKQRVSAERFEEMKREATPGLYRRDGQPLNAAAVGLTTTNPRHAAESGAARSGRRRSTTSRETEYVWHLRPVRAQTSAEGLTVYELTSLNEDIQFTRLMFVPLVVLLLCDFTRRIRAGQRGQVQSGEAFWPAVIGMIAAGILDTDNYILVAAGLCGGLSLLVQGAAASWPPSSRRLDAVPEHDPLSAILPRPAVVTMPTPPVPPPATLPRPVTEAAPVTPHVAARRLDPPTRPPGPDAVVIEGPPRLLPSLLAGLGWLGLLLGLFGALGSAALQSETVRGWHDWLPAALVDGWLAESQQEAQRYWTVGAVAVGGLLLLSGRMLAGQGVLWSGLIGVFGVVILTRLMVGPQAESLRGVFDGLYTGNMTQLWKTIWIFVGIAVSLRLISLRRVKRATAR